MWASLLKSGTLFALIICTRIAKIFAKLWRGNLSPPTILLEWWGWTTYMGLCMRTTSHGVSHLSTDSKSLLNHCKIKSHHAQCTFIYFFPQKTWRVQRWCKTVKKKLLKMQCIISHPFVVTMITMRLWFGQAAFSCFPDFQIRVFLWRGS